MRFANNINAKSAVFVGKKIRKQYDINKVITQKSEQLKLI